MKFKLYAVELNFAKALAYTYTFIANLSSGSLEDKLLFPWLVLVLWGAAAWNEIVGMVERIATHGAR